SSHAALLSRKGAARGPNGGGTGSAPGKFNKPYDLDVDAEGSLWVVDFGNNRIQRMTTAGVYLSSLGSLGLDVAQFSTPSGIAIDGAGMVSVADSKNNRVQVFVDLNRPDTTITNGPGTETSLTTATFTFTANEPGATFECT